MKDKANKLIRGSLLNTSSLVLSVVISFFLMPFMIGSLGDRMYGVWTIVGELLWYYGLLDFGLSTAIGRFLAQSIGRKDPEEIKRLTSTSFYLTLGLGVLSLLASVFIYAISDRLLESPDGLFVFRVLIILLGVNFALEFPVRVFNGAIGANLRMDISMGIAIVKNVLVAIGVVLAIKQGTGVIGVAVVSVLGSLADSAARVYYAYKIEPNISLAWSYFKKDRVRKIFHYSVFSFIGKMADILRFKIDLIIISAFAGLGAVTHYFIGARLLEYFIQFIRASIESIGPVFSQEEGKNDYQSIREKFLFVTKISIYLSIFFGGLAILFGKPFIERWMGPDYHDSYIVLIILIGPAIVALLQNTSDHLLYGISKHRFIAYASLCEGSANLILSLILVQKYGIYGVAMGTGIPMTIRFLIEPFYVCHVIQLSIKTYFNTVFRHCMIAVGLLGSLWVLTNPFVRVSYPHLFSVFMVVSFVFWPVAFFSGFGRIEREYVLSFLRRKS